MTASSFYPDVSFGPLLSATFLERPNRFLVIARLAGRRVRVASRDPGRLHGLLVPGAEILVAPAPAAGARRRTRYTLTLVRRGRRWVCLVPALANRILESALRRGGVPGLEGARILRREVLRGRSRFDFLLSYNGSRLLTEIKSVTFVTRRRALFPDAPTVRGVRHVRELMPYRRGALVIFLVQRSDADLVTPFAARDPAFAAVVATAVRAGVRVLAFACRVTRKGVRLVRAIPVRL